MYKRQVLVNDAPAGLVVSTGYGHRVGASIAMAVIDTDVLVDGAAVAVDVLGRTRHAQIVEGNALYDASNTRLKV